MHLGIPGHLRKKCVFCIVPVYFAAICAVVATWFSWYYMLSLRGRFVHIASNTCVLFGVYGGNGLPLFLTPYGSEARRANASLAWLATLENSQLIFQPWSSHYFFSDAWWFFDGCNYREASAQVQRVVGTRGISFIVPIDSGVVVRLNSGELEYIGSETTLTSLLYTGHEGFTEVCVFDRDSKLLVFVEDCHRNPVLVRALLSDKSEPCLDEFSLAALHNSFDAVTCIAENTGSGEWIVGTTSSVSSVNHEGGIRRLLDEGVSAAEASTNLGVALFISVAGEAFEFDVARGVKRRIGVLDGSSFDVQEFDGCCLFADSFGRVLSWQDEKCSVLNAGAYRRLRWVMYCCAGLCVLVSLIEFLQSGIGIDCFLPFVGVFWCLGLLADIKGGGWIFDLTAPYRLLFLAIVVVSLVCQWRSSDESWLIWRFVFSVQLLAAVAFDNLRDVFSYIG